MKGSAPVQSAGAVTLTGHGRVDLLNIDGPGSLELDRRGAGLRFQVLTEREPIASFAAKQITGEGFTLRCIKKRRPVRHEPFPRH